MAERLEELIGMRVAEARVKIGMSQSELAQRCGLTQVSICKIETGQTARSRYFPQIARQLRVSLDWLLHGGDFPLGNASRETNTALTQAWADLDKAITNLLSAPPTRITEAATHLLKARNAFSEVFLSC